MSSVFDDEMVQMRITDLEYQFPEMTDVEIIAAIERIYLEEMGRPINTKMNIERMDSYSESMDAKDGNCLG